MSDPYAGRAPDIAGPVENAEAVVPNNSADLSSPSRGLWVGGAGDVKVTMLGGQTVTFTAMNVGFHPIRVTRIFATGTTATNMVAVW